MMHLLILLALAPNGGAIGENNAILRERAMSPTPVTDKDLRPVKLPDCRSDAEIQITLKQIRNGEPELCFIRDRQAFRAQ